MANLVLEHMFLCARVGVVPLPNSLTRFSLWVFSWSCTHGVWTNDMEEQNFAVRSFLKRSTTWCISRCFGVMKLSNRHGDSWSCPPANRYLLHRGWNLLAIARHDAIQVCEIGALMEIHICTAQTTLHTLHYSLRLEMKVGSIISSNDAPSDRNFSTRETRGRSRGGRKASQIFWDRRYGGGFGRCRGSSILVDFSGYNIENVAQCESVISLLWWFCINVKTHDIREGNVTIKSEIQTENIRSLESRDLKEWHLRRLVS